MKKAKLGDFLLWNCKPAQIVAVADRPTVVINMLEERKCPHCQEPVGKDQFSVIVESPLFQENAQKVQTIEES